MIFFVLIIAADQIIGKVLYLNISKINYGIIGKINNSINNNHEILILGSSRANHHYDPDIICNKTEKSCFNAGLGGYGIFLSYAILNEISKKNIPELVILDISPNVMIYKGTYKRLSSLMPFFKKYNSFREIIKLNPDYNNLGSISNTYTFNSTLYDFVRNEFYTNNSNGFKKLSGVIDDNKFEPFYFGGEPIDNLKMEYYKKIINICKEKNIRLYCIISPTYEKFDKNNEVINIIKKIALKNNVKFYDFSDDTSFYCKKKFFKDQLHMNSDGAILFSKKIAKLIKSTSFDSI